MAPDRVAAVCEHADPVLVRDDTTAAFLADLGVEDAVVAGCPALFLDRYVIDMPGADPDLAGTALLSVRNPRLMSIDYRARDRVHRDVAALIGRLGEEFDRVALLCHDYQDLAFAAGFDGAAIRYTEDARTFIAWLRGCAINVGYRLHGFLACVALDVPALHVSYDERGESMIDTLGLGPYDVALHETSDVASAVLERLHALGLRSPRADADPALARMHDAQTRGVARLAARARDPHRTAAT